MDERLTMLFPNGLIEAKLVADPTPIDRAMDACRLSLTAGSAADVAECLKRARLEITLGQTIVVEEADFADETPSYEQSEELDRYMQVDHVKSDQPFAVLLNSWIIALEGSLRLAGRSEDLESLWAGFSAQLALLNRIRGRDTANSGVAATRNLAVAPPQTNTQIREQWRLGHWTFFVLTQGLILSLRRMKRLLNEPESAATELETATALMWASAAAMRITGAFTRNQYHQHVRPTMELDTPTSEVTRTSLSGIMTWDHRVLTDKVWKSELAGFFEKMPPELTEAHGGFVQAYRDGLSAGHLEVCSKFGGDGMGSLIAPDSVATRIIQRIEEVRMDQLRRR